jgi:hypothetical protein
MLFNKLIAVQIIALLAFAGRASAAAIEARGRRFFVVYNPTGDFKNLWFDGLSTGDRHIQVRPGASEPVYVDSGSSSLRVYEGCTPGNPAAGCGIRLNTATKLEWTMGGFEGDTINFSMGEQMLHSLSESY